MVSKCPILSGIVRSNVRFTEVCMIRVPLSARPQSLRLACKLLLRKQSLIPWLAYNTLSSESFCTMASVSSYPGPQTEISTGNSSPKLHARMVYSETGKDNPGQPSAADIDQRLKDWESDIDIKKLTVDSHKKIHHCHLMAVKEGKEVYEDPVTGFEVFTILAHIKRGYCCGNACRHCPYKHVNVPSKFREIREYNSSFYA